MRLVSLPEFLLVPGELVDTDQLNVRQRSTVRSERHLDIRSRDGAVTLLLFLLCIVVSL